MLLGLAHDGEGVVGVAGAHYREHALIGEALSVLKPRELKVFRDRRLTEKPRTLEELEALKRQ